MNDEVQGGYTEEQVSNGDYPPIVTLLTPELAAEVAAARSDGRPLYVPTAKIRRPSAA